MDDTYVISRVQPNDWSIFRDVRLSALADSPESFGSDRSTEAGYDDEHWRTLIENAAVFVAATANQYAGIAVGLQRESDEEAGLGGMWVLPSWRGRGVATALLGEVTAWARSQGCRRLSLWAPADDPRARSFYRREGFEDTGNSKPFPSDSGRLAVEMSLHLR